MNKYSKVVNNFKLNLSKLKHLDKDVMAKRSSYEKDLCEVMDFEHKSTRYYDCLVDGEMVELKKCQKDGWANSSVFAEICLGQDYRKNITTVIMQYNKDSKMIKTILFIKMPKLIEYMLNPTIEELRKEYPYISSNREAVRIIQTIGQTCQLKRPLKFNELRSIASDILIL